MLLVFALAVACAGVFAGSASASPGALKILIVYADSSAPVTLKSQLLAQPGVAAVDTFNGGSYTPSDTDLDAYDEVVTFSNDSWADPNGLGNSLADFQDQGGAVVGATFDWITSGYAVGGRWAAGGYAPYQTGAASEYGSWTLGTHDATNPLMAGVNGLSANYRNTPALSPGATEIAQWNDGKSLVAFKGNALGISAYLGDGAGPGQWSGDFPRLIVNAGNVLGRHTLTVGRAGTGSGTVTSSPAGINCGATCSANYTNGSTVKLTASASPGSAFTGWSGGGCSGTSSTCTVTMNAAKAVTVTFVRPPQNAKIGKAKINKKKHTAKFKFTASGTVSGFQCALVRPEKNGKLPKKPKLVWRSCKSPKLYKHLKHGHYKFEVRAVNAAGHSNPAIRKFTL